MNTHRISSSFVHLLLIQSSFGSPPDSTQARGLTPDTLAPGYTLNEIVVTATRR